MPEKPEEKRGKANTGTMIRECVLCTIQCRGSAKEQYTGRIMAGQSRSERQHRSKSRFFICLVHSYTRATCSKMCAVINNHGSTGTSSDYMINTCRGLSHWARPKVQVCRCHFYPSIQLITDRLTN